MSKKTNDEQRDQVRAAVRDQYAKVATENSNSSCSPGCCGPAPNASLALGYSSEDLGRVPEGANWRLRFALIACMVLPAHFAPANECGFNAGANDDAQAPCTDFYQYACAPWLGAHPIPADRSAWDPYYELAQENAEAVRAILEGRGPDGGDDAAKIRDDYTSCLDEAAIENAGMAPLAA